MSFNSESAIPGGDDFKPFEAPPVAVAEKKSNLDQVLKSGDAAFNIQSSFWDALLKDTWIKQEIEKVIQERVSTLYNAELKDRLDKEVQAEKERGYKEGYSAGHTEGEALAKKTGEEGFALVTKQYKDSEELLLNRMNALSLHLLEEKQNILKSHERDWLDALKQVVTNFPMVTSVEWFKTLELWVSERIEAFKTTGKIRIFLSKEDFLSLSQLTAEVTSLPWSFSEDSNLKAGELRAECGDGGLLFSKPECIEEITKIITDGKC